jgi:hypothetical protein
MSNRKNYNSIVFLTTLSVYLGLVLVGGATPSVLAQAALTRNFDIKNEIVVEDDLDKKPDDDEKLNFSGSLEKYFDDVESFFNDLQKLHKIEKFDLDYDAFEVNELGFVPCNVDGDPIRTVYSDGKIDNRWLEPAIVEAVWDFREWIFLSDCLKHEKYKNGISTSTNLKLIYDKSELKIEVSGFKSSPQRAEQLAAKFNQASKSYEIDEEKSIVKKIHETTSFKSENNQIFIVTRLPRGSIDALLAEK